MPHQHYLSLRTTTLCLPHPRPRLPDAILTDAQAAPLLCEAPLAAARTTTRATPLDAVALSRLDPHDIEPLLTGAVATFLSSA